MIVMIILGMNLKVLISSFCLVTVLIFSVFSAGCPYEDQANNAIAAFDRAITAASVANADWETIVQRLLNELPDDVSATIRNDVSNTLNRGVAAAGIETRCGFDFVRTRVVQDLIRIRAKLKGEPVNPPEPAFCQAIPNTIQLSLDMASRPNIEYDGYDYDAAVRPKVFLQQKNGQEIDVSQYLSVTHHYQMTLNLGPGAIGSLLNDKIEKVVLKWNDKILSEIPVIQAPCKVQTITKTPELTSWMPPHTRGDAEFDGNGPSVHLDVYIRKSAEAVYADIFMRAEETDSDWTMADGWTSIVLYEPPPGYEVVGVSPNTEFHHQYTDTNHDNDKFPIGSGTVASLEYTGDTDSDDEAGKITKVHIRWSQFQFQIRQKGNCIV